MKPFRLTAIVTHKDTGKTMDKIMLFSPDSVLAVMEDELAPLKAGDGIIPIINSGMDTAPIPCRRVNMKNGQMFSVRESLAEVEKRWGNAWTSQIPLPADVSSLS